MERLLIHKTYIFSL